MDKVCPKCKNYVAPEDPKGDGTYICYYCIECGIYLEDN